MTRRESAAAVIVSAVLTLACLDKLIQSPSMSASIGLVFWGIVTGMFSSMFLDASQRERRQRKRLCGMCGLPHPTCHHINHDLSNEGNPR